MTTQRQHLLWLVVILLLSVPIKLAAAHNMQWDIDIVPVLSRGYDWLNGGDFPAYGTLSSVAAYNMPALQWLHLPALIITRNAYLSILVTMLAFNLISTAALYRLGASMFNPRVGLVAALLFTFSEIGISSAYTAWAQVLLPGLYALVVLCLWEWRQQQRGIFLALSGVLATFAIMTHFSAILLLPAMLLFALLSRAQWQWDWLIAGAVASVLLLTPYLLFEVERDFSDVRSFLTQETQIPPDVMAQYTYLKPESGALQNWATRPKPALQQSRLQRGIDFVRSIPRQYWRSLNLPFAANLQALAGSPLGLFVSWTGALFWLVVLWFGWQTSHALWYWFATHQQKPSLPDAFPPRPEGEGMEVRAKVGLLLSFILVIVSGFIISRNIDQSTYFMGLVSLQVLIVAVPFGYTGVARQAPTSKLSTYLMIALWLLLFGYAAVNVAERAARLNQHDDTVDSRYNVSLYRHVAAATDYIASDWQGGTDLTVSYDIMPEMRNLWWVAPWHTVDASYRMGMNFDFLLTLHHGLQNQNETALGWVDDADYIVVYEYGLERHALAEYHVQHFGTIYVLKPR